MAIYYGHQEDASGNLLLPTPHSLVTTANIELGSTASNAYTVGTYIVYNNRLCQVTKAIARGNTLSTSSSGNLEEATVGYRLAKVETALDDLLVQKVFTYSYTVAANSYLWITSQDIGFSTPSGYTFCCTGSFETNNRYINVEVIRYSTSSSAQVVLLSNSSSSSVSGTLRLYMVFAKSRSWGGQV